MFKRELDTSRDKRFLRRDESGQFNKSTDVGRSLRKDVKRTAKIVVKSWQHGTTAAGGPGFVDAAGIT
jgi:hypothetical protein